MPDRRMLRVLAALLGFGPAVTGASETIPAPQSQAPSGAEIYRRVLDNRFDSFEQRLSLESGDEGGRYSLVEIVLKYLNLRGEDPRVISKSLARYLAPMDVRHLGYLSINKRDGSEDQFVYRPSARRVQRVNLRGEAIAGTDLSLEDILPSEFEKATYRRLENTAIRGLECQVVEITPVDEAESQYSKLVLAVDPDRGVPIRTEYWSPSGVKVKELRSDVASIKRYIEGEGGAAKMVWIAEQSTVFHIKDRTYTTLRVRAMDPNPSFSLGEFSERELAAGH